MLAFSESLKHELTDKGVRVQVVLPGATATDFWGAAGTPVEHLSAEIVMPAGEMVDAVVQWFQAQFDRLFHGLPAPLLGTRR